jgi:NTE family protein
LPKRSDESVEDNLTSMNRVRMLLPTALAALLGLGGCATAPSNSRIDHTSPTAGYRFETREQYSRNKEDIVVLAFSGGGTRAATFSYGVLEVLRNTEVIRRNGQRERLLDSVDVITGVSGGSFTALAYGLYGDRLFGKYEQRFPGPMIAVSATDLNSGARFYFTQKMFDILCSDLSTIRLSRAAASSSGVPVVLSPVTIDNYGGGCGYKEPSFLARIEKSTDIPRPVARAVQEL